MKDRAFHIHITGASGSGVSTLGHALAARLQLTHLDTDDFYWEATDPPYQLKRPIDKRLDRIRRAFEEAHQGWVLSGSLDSWGEPLVNLFDLVVFIETPAKVRLERLRSRELARHGAEALAPGGAMHATHTAFMAWAACYERGDRSGRSLTGHRAWLQVLPCPWLHVEGIRPVETLVEDIEAGLAELQT
ncbi:Adenylate kinase [Consotaella salsifontis]|uniref:Adenylate kinase n=2 Tax=Consotaella salsifontis TaxID=1365950 RepID=A0A1T4RAT5_9HYPH|nr:AAA family ATPase [Consotaella salsifontis]SKA13083.1 Adenylate kinase [Consotaella salsifontis]